MESRAWEGWQQLEAAHPEEMKVLKDFLRQYPTNLRITAGKAKRLRGQLQGYYQYDVTYSDRVRYQVNKKSRAVKIAYAGGHP